MDALKLRDQRLTPVPFKHFLVVQHAVKLQVRLKAVRSIGSVQWIAIRRSKDLDPKQGKFPPSMAMTAILEAPFNVHPLQLVIKPIYFFLKITQLVHFSDILSRMILEN